MIALIRAIWLLIKGLFVEGGFLARGFAFFSNGFGAVITVLTTFASGIFTLITGGIAIFWQVWSFVASYHIVELIRRFALIALIVPVFGWVINYFVNSIIIYDNKTLALLFSSFIQRIESLGQWGHFALALLSKMGFFEASAMFLTVMLYVLFVRVALSILFK